MKIWKWLGLAALFGIGAAGAAVAVQRRQRHWRNYDADELRHRLHQRLAEADPRI